MANPFAIVRRIDRIVLERGQEEFEVNKLPEKQTYWFWKGPDLEAVSRPIDRKPTLQEMQDQLHDGETLVAQYRILAGRMGGRFVAKLDEAAFERWEGPNAERNVQERAFFALRSDHGGEFVTL